MRTRPTPLFSVRRASRVTASVSFLALLAPLAGAHESIIRQGPESAETPEALDLFGSVLCAGDFNGDGYEDLATAAPYEDLPGFPGSDQGVVIINWGSDVGLTHVGSQVVLPAISQHALLFGFSMTSADFQGDGFDELVVGMPFADRGGQTDAGAIAVYRGSVLGFVTLPVVYDSADFGGAIEAGDELGLALDAGDFDGDGDADLVVGVPGEDADAGAVFFVRGTSVGLTTAGATTVSQSTFGVPDVPGDRFGRTVAIGNFDTGVQNDVAIGAPGKDSALGTTQMGMVVLLPSSSSGPQPSKATLYTPLSLSLAGATDSGRSFGSALAAGDFDQDGIDDLAVGRPGSSSFPGEVVVLRGAAGGKLVYGATRTSNDYGIPPAAGDRFAESLASGDFDTDGFEDLLVGSPGHTQYAFVNLGRVYLYRSNPVTGLGSWDDFQNVDLSVDYEGYEELGVSVAFGYFDDTGRANMVAGAPGAEGNVGRVHVIAPWRQPPPLLCRNSIVKNCNDRIVFSQKPFDPVYVASAAKTMTILIAAERAQLPPSDPKHVGLNTVYEIPDWVANDIGGSQFYVLEGELCTLRALMDMTMSVSGNDAAYAIADLLTGSNAVYNDEFDVVPDFIAEMNARAAQIGMLNTTFTTPNGFSGATPESTAYDMALLGRVAMQNPLFESVVNNMQWSIPRTIPTQGGGYYSFSQLVPGGFVAALQGFLPQGTGAKDGGTFPAGITGVFSAREDSYPWGTTVGSSFNTPFSAGWIVPDAAALLKFGLDNCSSGPIVTVPSLLLPWDEVPNIPVGDGTDTHVSFYPPDPIHKEEHLEVYPQVLDGLSTELGLEVLRVSTTSIPLGQTALYATQGVSGHDGVTLVNEGQTVVYVSATTNTVGDPFFNFFLQPKDSGQIPAAQLPSGVTSFEMSLFTPSAEVTNLRVTERYSEDYVLGLGPSAPAAMVFDRPNPTYVTTTLLEVKVIGEDDDPQHLVGLVLRGPDPGYTFDPCRAATVPYGTGWSGRYGVPTLATDVPPVLGSTMTFRFGNSLLADTSGFWAIGFQSTAAATTLGGTLNVVPFALLPLSLPAAGFELPLPLGTDPFLCGLSAYHQLFVLDPFASDGLSFSRGLQVQMGH